jgi:hypothetical protein
MIEISENAPADDLLESVGGALAPLTLTENLNELGYKNTFLAGYFYNGAPLLKRYQTPANSRTDVNTNPDPYNQTTPAESHRFWTTSINAQIMEAELCGQFRRCNQTI